MYINIDVNIHLIYTLGLHSGLRVADGHLAVADGSGRVYIYIYIYIYICFMHIHILHLYMSRSLINNNDNANNDDDTTTDDNTNDISMKGDSNSTMIITNIGAGLHMIYSIKAYGSRR